MTVKEWAEEYRRVNEWEDVERREWLRSLTVEQAFRIYQEICRMVQDSDNEDDPVLWEMRMEYFRDWEQKMRRVAQRLGHDLPV